MLQLHSYINKIYNIQWYFNSSQKKDLERLLFVKFEKQNDYYLIKTIEYTYIDILCALREMDFELSKINDVLKLKILKM